MSRNVKFAIVAAAALAVAAALITSLAQGSSGSPLDSGLKASASRLAKRLHQPDGPYASQASFLNAFNLFQHQQQTVLLSDMRSRMKPGQFAQIALYETNTMPAVFRQLRSASKPQIVIDGDLLNRVADGETVTTTVHQGNLEFRAFLMPLRVPPTLRQSQTYEILEVFQAQQS